MLFSSATFLFYFFPAFLLLYYALPWKNAVLLGASLFFYAWGEPRFVLLLPTSALLNYGVGYLLGQKQIQGKMQAQAAKRWLAVGVATNLLLLFHYKYLAFVVGALLPLFPPGGHATTLPEATLPLGLSFFTFQGISYLMDVYRGDVKPQRSFWRFAMYKAMFPQLIAGPIVRYRDISADILQRTMDGARIWQGLGQFILGLCQKVLLANTVALAADRIFAQPANLLPASTAWLGLICYSLQILYDFSGYSNMAIGIGHMIGFRYPANFNQPYSARSVTDFWRRWHISLSSWFRDYVYLPLGGNRGTPLQTHFNLWLVFVLCGLWHGAAWTFLLWGLWHGLGLTLERLGLARRLVRWPALLAQGWTLLWVLAGWVWFRAASVEQGWQYWQALLGWHQPSQSTYLWQIDIHTEQWLALAIGAVCALYPASAAAGERASAPANAPAASALPAPLSALLRALRKLPTLPALPALRIPAAALGLFLCAATLAGGTYNPFIYFHF
jgi:alginate O-acetyltransferase complex protein AlgI